jgi:hypothetical protein
VCELCVYRFRGFFFDAFLFFSYDQGQGRMECVEGDGDEGEEEVE